MPQSLTLVPVVQATPFNSTLVVQTHTISNYYEAEDCTSHTEVHT